MAEAVLEIVLENLNSLIQQELRLFLGFNQDKERLASLFTTIKAMLEDAEEKQFSDRAIKDWLGKLKDAAHILDDILDECAYEALRLEHQGVKCGLSDKVQSSCLSSFHPKNVVFHYKIAKKMKGISERLEEIAKERTSFHLTEIVRERGSGVIDWRQTTSFITEPQVYGREKDTDNIVDFLIGDASHFENLLVYSIIGLGGLGKTTLAQLIFKHERVVNHFELRIWICVSEDFTLKRMIKAIIEATSRNSCEDLDLEPLQGRLQDLLQRKRYLLVLDDVWSDEQENWERLKSILACGAKGASILVTTRLRKVAAIMGTMPPYELSVLSDNDCWELFKHRAFAPNEVEQARLVVIGKEIVKKCGGVPLAAKALGGLLRFKREEKEWLNVKESNLWSLPQNEKNSIMPVLRLSYLDLPVKLRQCFAYCAIFPKDAKISKQHLIELWMASGFISSSEMLDAEDIGDGVWKELYWRSFFQDIEIDEVRKVTIFKMHDLAQFLAEDVCCITDDNGVTTLSDRIHHLSDHRDMWNNVSEETFNSMQLHRVKSLRTYIGELRPVVFKCYSLRVLESEAEKELPSSIGHLKHLRYLNLSESNFKTLPESLCKLWNLQILKLDSCDSLEKLPDSLTCLKVLQQLSLKGCISLSSLPPQLGKLTSLRNLSTYLVGKERGFLLAELGSLKLKGFLCIKHLGRVKSVIDAKEANMSSKKLNGLWLSWDENEESELQENVEEILEVLQPDTQQLESLRVEGYKGAHFPQWMSSSSLKELNIEGCRNFNVSAGFQCLEDLSIYNCKEVKRLHEALQHMTSLQMLHLWELPKLESLSGCFGNLPLLRYLMLRDLPNLTSLPECLRDLPLLRMLFLWNLPNLESLPDCIGKLPLLHQLRIYDCSKLTSLPTSLRLSSLEELEIYGCSELEEHVRLRREQERTGQE